MVEVDSNMSTPIKPKRNPWVLPALILWAFTPAILITSSILGGLYSNTPHIGYVLLMVGFYGMPIILYAWGVTVILWFGVKLRVKAALFGIPLTLVMCAANLFLGFAGCTRLSKIVPQEGIF
jgi:hypothetical protein